VLLGICFWVGLGEGVVQEFLERVSFRGFQDYQIGNHIDTQGGYKNVFRNLEFSSLHFFLKFVGVFSWEGHLAAHHLEQDDANGPEISPLIVQLSFENLRCHIVRCAQIGGHHGIFLFIKDLGQAKVSKLNGHVA